MVRTPENTPLATVPQPTKQEIFDAVVAHAATMPRKCQSFIPHADDPDRLIPGACVYRGPDGNACFLGGVLTDAEAAPLDALQHSSFSSIRETYPHLIPERFRGWELRHFMGSLQSLHDIHDPEEWPEALRTFGRVSGLDTSSIDRSFGA